MKFYCKDCKKEITGRGKTGFCLSCAKKGQNNFMFNKKHTEKTKEKMRGSRISVSGENHPNFKYGSTLIRHYCIRFDCNNEISYGNWLHGKQTCLSCSMKERFSIHENHPMFGKENKWGNHTIESKSKISLSHGGTGTPYENTEYGAEFDSNLKEQIRFRDGYKCKVCGCTQLENGRQLDVHHKDYNKKNNKPDNLASLCMTCHRKTNGNRDYWIEYFKRGNKTCLK